MSFILSNKQNLLTKIWSSSQNSEKSSFLIKVKKLFKKKKI